MPRMLKVRKALDKATRSWVGTGKRPRRSSRPVVEPKSPAAPPVTVTVAARPRLGDLPDVARALVREVACNPREEPRDRDGKFLDYIALIMKVTAASLRQRTWRKSSPEMWRSNGFVRVPSAWLGPPGPPARPRKASWLSGHSKGIDPRRGRLERKKLATSAVLVVCEL